MMESKNVGNVSLESKSGIGEYESFPQMKQEHRLYRKRLDDEFSGQTEYKWLHRFLNTPGTSASEMRVNILDCVGDHLQSRGSFSDVDEEFSSQLSNRSDDAQLRLIIVTYRNSWLVDRSMLDLLGWTFDIHPDFLRRHFFYYFIYVEDGIPQDELQFEEDSIHSVPHAFLCDENRDEFHLAATRSYHKLSAFYHKGSNTVLIWIRDTNFVRMDSDSEPTPHPSTASVFSGNKGMISRYLSAINQMSAHDVRCGVHEWVYFLYPYIRGLILCFMATSYGDRRDMDTENFISDPKNSGFSVDIASGNLYQILYESGALRKLQHEIKRIHALCITAEARRKFALLQEDAEQVDHNFDRSAQYFREAKAATLTAAQLDEAHASTDAALSVNRLSRLAFFFIPLSFTASCFGMNIVEFGQGSVHLRTFFITAIVISLCTLIPLWYSMVVAIKKSGFLDNTRIIIRLFTRSPSLAVLYLGLCVQFEQPIVMALCGQEVAQILSIRLIFGYKRMEREEAIQRMRRSYYSFGNEDSWVERAQRIVDRLEKLKVADHHVT